MKAYKLALMAASAFGLVVVAAPAAQAQFAYCKADVQRLCAGVQPGGHRIINCLKAHQDEVTVGCAKELKALKAKMGK
jgi:hypothetical protein